MEEIKKMISDLKMSGEEIEDHKALIDRCIAEKINQLNRKLAVARSIENFKNNSKNFKSLILPFEKINKMTKKLEKDVNELYIKKCTGNNKVLH